MASSILYQAGARSLFLFWLELEDDRRSRTHQGSPPGLTEPDQPPSTACTRRELPKAASLSKSSRDKEATTVAAPRHTYSLVFLQGCV